MAHFEAHNILHDAQHGFRKGRSCKSQLILTTHELARGLDDKSQIDAILLDFSKAFDKVPHRRLLYKLDRYGVHGQTLTWISAFLSGCSQRVVCEGYTSPSAAVISGVPHGTVLGPLLFLAYINDLPECVSSTPRLFADDCLLYRQINSIEDSELLQQDVDRLQDWENKWMMSFNPSKCEVLRVTIKRKNLIEAAYTIHGQPLKIVSSAKYLGLTIDSELNYNEHISNICKKANSTRAFIHRNTRSCPRKVKATAHTSFVRPQLEYASTVRCPQASNNINRLEAVQHRAAQSVMNDWSRPHSQIITTPRSTRGSPTIMMQQLGWSTLEERRKQATAVMMYRIFHGQTAIPAPVYLTPNTQSTRGHGSRFCIPAGCVDACRHGFFPVTSCSRHFMHLCHARNYSQEDMCIIGKEEEEEEEEEAAVENVDARCWNTRIMGVINRVMLYVGVLLFT